MRHPLQTTVDKCRRLLTAIDLELQSENADEKETLFLVSQYAQDLVDEMVTFIGIDHKGD